MRTGLLSVCLTFALLCAWPARAQKIQDNHYTIDNVTTPVLGGGRILGMAGAHIAIASGIDGAAFNPAGYAERYEKEIDWFAFDVTGGLSLSNVFKQNDFDNDGKTNKSSGTTRQVSLGARVQLSYFGTGANWLQRRYTLRGSNANYDVTLDTWRTGVGYSFADGSLVVGTTLAVYKFGVAAAGDPSTFQMLTMLTPFGRGHAATNFRGFGAEWGVLYRPAYRRYRMGLVATTPVKERLQNDVPIDPKLNARASQGLILPKDVHVPWQVGAGFAYQFGERRTNTPWRNTQHLRRDLAKQIAEGTYFAPETYGEAPYPALPKDDPEAALDVAMANWREAERRFRRHQPRRYILLAADVLMYGRTTNGQGIDAFLQQNTERSGQKISFGARVGVESELWPDRMKVRAGTYLEPSRFKGSDYRPHATAGFDVRLFDFWRWSCRGTATTDLAPRYFNWGIAFGLWW